MSEVLGRILRREVHVGGKTEKEAYTCRSCIDLLTHLPRHKGFGQ